MAPRKNKRYSASEHNDATRYDPISMTQVPAEPPHEDEYELGILNILGDADDLDSQVRIIVHQRDESRRQRLKYVCGLCAIVVVIVGAVTFGSWSRKRSEMDAGSGSSGGGMSSTSSTTTNGSYGGNGGGGSSSSSPTTNDYTFDPPSYDLSVICSPTYVQLQDGYKQCRQACAPANCCFAEEIERSCFDANPDLCFMYESCKSLNADDGTSQPPVWTGGGGSTVVVPPAPSNLDELCSEKTRRDPDGLVVCRDVCLVAACCWTKDESSCFDVNREVCQGYVKCFPSSKGETDHEKGEGVVANDGGDGGLPDFDDTSKYPPPSPSSDGSAPAPGNQPSQGQGNGAGTPWTDIDIAEVQTKCLPNDSDMTRRSQCQLLCRSRFCCFDSDPARNCKVDRSRECNTFASCGYAKRDKISPAPAPTAPAGSPSSSSSASKPWVDPLDAKDVQDKCRPNDNDAARKMECERLCATKMCCFSSDPAVNCHAGDRAEECNTFAACGYLSMDVATTTPGSGGSGGASNNSGGTSASGGGSGSGSDVDAMAAEAEEVRDLCKPNDTDGRRRHECKALCKSKICCFDPRPPGIESCASDRPEECQLFDPCRHAMEEEDQYWLNMGNVGGGNAGLGEPAPAPSPPSPPSPSSSTSSGGASAASSYDPPPSNISELCSKANIRDDVGYNRCVDACGPSMCCAGLGGGHSTMEGDAPCSRAMCLQYGDCSHIWELANELEAESPP